MTGREEVEDEADQGTTPVNGDEAVHHIHRYDPTSLAEFLG